MRRSRQSIPFATCSGAGGKSSWGQRPRRMRPTGDPAAPCLGQKGALVAKQRGLSTAPWDVPPGRRKRLNARTSALQRFSDPRTPRPLQITSNFGTQAGRKTKVLDTKCLRALTPGFQRPLTFTPICTALCRNVGCRGHAFAVAHRSPAALQSERARQPSAVQTPSQKAVTQMGLQKGFVLRKVTRVYFLPQKRVPGATKGAQTCTNQPWKAQSLAAAAQLRPFRLLQGVLPNQAFFKPRQNAKTKSILAGPPSSIEVSRGTNAELPTVRWKAAACWGCSPQCCLFCAKLPPVAR